MLGDLIARFDDEAVASETLLSLGDLVLTASLAALAAENGVSAGAFAMRSVGEFVNSASDEDWLKLVGKMARVENPGAVFLRCALSTALS